MNINRPLWVEPDVAYLSDPNITLYSMPAPGSGPLLVFMMNVLDGYNFNEHSIDANNSVLTYQRITETFKYAYAKRTLLGDPAFENITEVWSLRSNSSFHILRVGNAL